MFCENCGEKVSKDDAFCTNCGNPIKKEETVTTDEEKTEEVKTEEIVSESNTEEVVTETEPEKEPENKVMTETVNNKVQKENIKKGAGANVVLAILAIVVVLAGVAAALYFFVFNKNKDNKDEKTVNSFEKAVENMADLKSYTLVVSGEASTSGDEAFDASVNLETNLDIANKLAKFNGKISYSGVSIEIPGYVDFSDKDNGYLYVKMPAAIGGDNSWTKISLADVDFEQIVNDSTNNDVNSDEELKQLKEKLSEVGLIKKGNSDDSETDYYEITINEEYLKKLKEIYEDFDLTDSDIESLNLKDGFVIGVYVNKKENYVSKMTIDMTKYLNTLLDGEMEFDKLSMTIEIKDINSVSSITIPDDAKNAKETNISGLNGGSGNNSDPDDNDDDNDNDYVDDYSIDDYGFVVKYTMPTGFEASSVNSEDFKIYRKGDELRVTISNYWDSKDERFEDIESDKEFYEESDNYKNVSLSDEKTITVNGKEFAYKILSYETSYGKKYEAHVCYQLDDEHVYRVEYEKEDKEITESDLKLFLDITVTEK